jgi:hypothetical protein
MATPGEIAYLAWWGEYEHGHGYDHEAWLNLSQRHKNAWEAAAMDGPDPYEYRTIRIPRGTDIDGAVVELHDDGPTGNVTMDIRIPAHQEPAMAEHKVGTMVVLTGTIMEIEDTINGPVAWVRVDKALADSGTIAVRLGKLPAAPYDAVHGDEDRIRDAMAEARDHPGRTVTR